MTADPCAMPIGDSACMLPGDHRGGCLPPPRSRPDYVLLTDLRWTDGTPLFGDDERAAS